MRALEQPSQTHAPQRRQWWRRRITLLNRFEQSMHASTALSGTHASPAPPGPRGVYLFLNWGQGWERSNRVATTSVSEESPQHSSPELSLGFVVRQRGRGCASRCVSQADSNGSSPEDIRCRFAPACETMFRLEKIPHPSAYTFSGRRGTACPSELLLFTFRGSGTKRCVRHTRCKIALWGGRSTWMISGASFLEPTHRPDVARSTPRSHSPVASWKLTSLSFCERKKMILSEANL